MSDGQLKKRMESLTQQPEEWVTEDMDTGTSDRMLVNLGETLSIIDEAKKKFPTVEQAVEEIKKSDKLLSKKERAVFSILEVRSMQLELAQNWFTEQFGDVE